MPVPCNKKLYKMDILNESYLKVVTENEKNLRFWENYLNTLKSLDFNVYSEKLTVPVLVPIGSRLLFRGEIKHTNEVTVALGSDYFVKCSVKQADLIKQHRIKVAQTNLDVYNKEKFYLDNQMSFTKQNMFGNQGEEIIEYHTEEEDKSWRLKHIQNVREYMQKKAKQTENMTQKYDTTEKELWERLDELELQEELENELNSMNDDGIQENIIESFVMKEQDYINHQINKSKSEKEKINKNVTCTKVNMPEQPSKVDLLQQVIERQNELGDKLLELKNIERSRSKTEQDLISKLDEMEQLDELEDEIDRLDDIIGNENINESEDEEVSQADIRKLQRRVSFVDEDDSETIDLTFKHSEVEPDNKPYNPDEGIQRPSDIYQAHSNLFGYEITSILKKSKYVKDVKAINIKQPKIKDEKEGRKSILPSAPEEYKESAPQTIVLKDIVEKIEQDSNKLESETKPMSLFKKKRMQNK